MQTSLSASLVYTDCTVSQHENTANCVLVQQRMMPIGFCATSKRFLEARAPLMQRQVGTMSQHRHTLEKIVSPSSFSLIPSCVCLFSCFLSHSVFHFSPACGHITHCRGGLRDRLAPQLQCRPVGKAGRSEGLGPVTHYATALPGSCQTQNLGLCLGLYRTDLQHVCLAGCECRSW